MPRHFGWWLWVWRPVVIMPFPEAATYSVPPGQTSAGPSWLPWSRTAILTEIRSGLRLPVPGSNLSEAAIGVAIRSCPGVQPRRSYSRLHAIIADSASFANSADRFANNFASDNHLHSRLKEIERSSCPFVNLPLPRGSKWGQGITASEMRFCHWVEPRLVCEFKFSELTRDERLRQPVFVGLREDKQAKEIVLEKA